MAISLAGCPDDAEVASDNISKAADNFEVARNIKFVDSIQGLNLLEIEGRCNIEHEAEGTTHDQLEVTCKDGPDSFRKHFLGLSNNVTYVVEQLDPIDVSEYHYRMTFK